MKYIKLLYPYVVNALTLTPLVNVKAVDQLPYLYMTQAIGSFDRTKDLNFNLYFNYAKNGYTIRFAIEKFDTLERIYRESYTIDNVTNSRTYGSAYVTFPAKEYLPDEGANVLIQGCDEYGGIIDTRKIPIYPKVSPNEIYANQYRNSPYVEEGYYFYFDVNKNLYTSEEFQFLDTIDYFSLEEDNSVDITKIQFTYKPRMTLFGAGSTKYLRISDTHNIFPYLSKDSEGYVNIPVVCVQSSNNISFKFNKKMYVKEDTLEISTTKKTGFVETTKFYIPLRKEKLLADEDIEIYIPSVGRGKTAIHIPLSYIHEDDPIGMCGISSHCIVGGIKS